jgi:hypothetical protein
MKRKDNLISASLKWYRKMNPNYIPYHNQSYTPAWHSWTAMKSRCKSNDPLKYKIYKGRGITYDPRWERFSAFLEDMGERPIGTSIDRLDSNKGYYKENCRWATMKQQFENKRPQTKTIPTCHPNKLHEAKGLCSACYQRNYR